MMSRHHPPLEAGADVMKFGAHKIHQHDVYPDRHHGRAHANDKHHGPARNVSQPFFFERGLAVVPGGDPTRVVSNQVAG